MPVYQGAFSPYEYAIYNLGVHELIEYAPDQSYPIASVTWTYGVATVTTTVANAIQPGDQLLISGVSPANYDGPVTAAVINSSTNFGYGLVPNPGPASVLAGAAATGQYFANVRRQFKMSAFVPGVIASSSDLSTSASMDNPAFMQGLTLFDLQLLKTPFGRAYAAIAMRYGTIWGLT
jgi:hypothetical protein